MVEKLRIVYVNLQKHSSKREERVWSMKKGLKILKEL